MILTFVLGAFVFLSGCGSNESGNSVRVKETKLTLINLASPFNDRHQEYSGLAWYKDNLVLLPQYLFGRDSHSATGYLFTIKKSVILDYLKNLENHPLIKPDTLKVIGKGLTRFNRRGSGYESIGFIGDNVYFTIESIGEPTRTFLIKGKINNSGQRITLDSATLTQIPLQTNILNIGYETMVIDGDRIIVINEANGANVNSNPKAFMYDENLKLVSRLSMPHIEYRITDATYVENNKFYAMNYFWTGDRNDLKPWNDSVATKYGITSSQSATVGVERVLSFVIGKNKIELSGEAPIYWKVIPKKGRNWEGIARLDDKGFLLITDSFPTSLLGFVKKN